MCDECMEKDKKIESLEAELQKRHQEIEALKKVNGTIVQSNVNYELLREAYLELRYAHYGLVRKLVR